MATLFERLDKQEAAVHAELDALREQVAVLQEKMAVAEERLSRLVITRETIQSLPEEYPGEEPVAEADDTPEDAVQAAGLIPGQRPAENPGAVSDPEPEGLRPGAVAPEPAPVKPDSTPGHRMRTPSVGIHLDEAVDRMLVLLTTSGREMKVRDIAVAIGETPSDRRIETTRSRLKALAKQGKVVEGHPGWFRIAPAPLALEPASDSTTEQGHGEVVDVR